jgi:hypothetical protein
MADWVAFMVFSLGEQPCGIPQDGFSISSGGAARELRRYGKGMPGEGTCPEY